MLMPMPMPHSDLSGLVAIPWTSRHRCFTARNGLTCMLPRQGGESAGGPAAGQYSLERAEEEVMYR